MMPVVAGRVATIRQMVVYAFTLVPLSVAPTATGVAGPGFGAFALVLSIAYLGVVLDLWRVPDDARARRAFRFSIIYLAGIYAALMVDAMVSA